MLLLGMGLFATAAFADDIPVQMKQLPDEAQHFVNKHFKDVQVAYATMDGSMMKSYEVGFVNGGKVDFDGKGRWTEIEMPNSVVPATLIPMEIMSYVSKNHPQQMVTSLERKKQGWMAELNNGLELKFDKKFRLIGMDH